MARVYGIKKGLERNGMDERTVKEIIGNGDLIEIVERMEKTLDADTLHRILDSTACTGGREYLKKCEKTGKEIADKPLSEKISYVNDNIYSASESIALNADGTLSVKWSFEGEERYGCVCSAAVKTGVRVSELAMQNGIYGRAMPLSYCRCCAGSGRRHLQLWLGLELKTREVVSSPINSGGGKPCVFIFEIL